MTVVKHRSAGATTPQGNGRAVALAILCTLLFLTSSAGGPGNAAIVQQVINAAYHAFGTGLHAALYLSAGLVICAGILAAVTLRPSPRPGGRTDAFVASSGPDSAQYQA
jgi:hypothetical protein